MKGHYPPKTTHALHEPRGLMHAGTDLVTTVTIYGAALLVTAGFLVAAVVDEVLRPRSRVRP
jgi:hypothetical protein